MSAIGSGTNPIYVDANGAAKASTESVGSESSGTSFKPIRMDAGTLKGAEGTIGTDTKPLKMVNGELQAVDKDLATKEELTVIDNRVTIIEGALGVLNKDSISCYVAPEESYFIESGDYENLGGGYTSSERHTESVTLTNGDVVTAVYYQHTSGTDTDRHYVGTDDNIEYQYKAALTDQIKFPVFSLTYASELISRYRASGSIIYIINLDKGVWRYSSQQVVKHPDSSDTTGTIIVQGKLNVSYSGSTVLSGSYDPTKIVSKDNLAYKSTLIFDTIYGNERHSQIYCSGSVYLRFLNVGLKDPMPQAPTQSECIRASGNVYVQGIWMFNTRYAFRNIDSLHFEQLYLPALLCKPSGYVTPETGASYMKPENADGLYLPTQIECGPDGIVAKCINLSDFGYIRIICSLHSNTEYPTVTADGSPVFCVSWGGNFSFSGCSGYAKRIDILSKSPSKCGLFHYYPHCCNQWGMWNWDGAPCDVSTACNINFYTENVTHGDVLELMAPSKWGATADEFVYNDGQTYFTSWTKLNQKKFDATGEVDCSSWPTLL